MLQTELIKKASDFARRTHAGQKRKTGEPYFNHCLKIAERLSDWGMDEATVAAGFLHDAVEDTLLKIEDIKKNFGEEVAFLVDGVTKLGKIKYRNPEEEQAENLRKMILALSQDLRVVVIKLADRLHNMQTLGALPREKQKRIALETTDIYAPLAYRLGMQNVSGQLEDLAFPYLYPQEHKWLTQTVKERYEEREKYLKKVKAATEKTLTDAKIAVVKTDLRAKRLSSLYKKLKKTGMDLEKIYDLVAVRIIVKTVADCYAVLGVIHQLWPPLPGRVKDYIAMPKPNGYRSLHTTVFCLDGKMVEFQIRTEEMHQEAEMGIAAHWVYAQAKNTKRYRKELASFADRKELAWVNQLRTWQSELPSSKEFLDSLKVDFLKDRIFAITPKGGVIDLPLGATPVDFAYAIHSEIGDACAGAKINGKIAPLEYRLQSGDTVEILIQKNKRPSDSWLKFVKTASARNKIKASLKQSRPAASKKLEAEFKLTVKDRVGLLKDISGVISRSHINIASVNTQAAVKTAFPIIRIRCEIKDKRKADELLLKLKKLKEVQEINCRLLQ